MTHTAAHTPSAAASSAAAAADGAEGTVACRVVSKSALFATDFVSSWLSYVSSLLLAHPLDTLRIRWQTLGQHPLTSLRADGVRSLYAGMATPILCNGPLIGFLFALNEFYRALARTANVRLLGRAELVSQPSFTVGELAISGFMAGATSSVLQTPVTIVRIQQQVSARSGQATTPSLHVVRALLKHEGAAGLYRAFPYDCLASGVGRMVYFTTYEVSKAQLAAAAPTMDPTAQKILAAAVTSTVGWAAVFPVDIIKNRMQEQPIGGPRQYRSFAHCCAVTYRAGGVRAFWTGFSLTIVRSFFSSGINLPVYDALKPRLRALVPSCAPDDGAAAPPVRQKL
jgi:hypothetical protein